MLAFLNPLCYYTQALSDDVYAPVAQLDRVTDYESVGRGFESLLAYHSANKRIWWIWPSWLRRQIVALKIVGSSPIIHPI